MASAAPRVAVVDDESSVRTMLGRVLRMAEYEVIAFASGEDFLASLATRMPARAILDVHTPGVSGVDVQSRLRAAHIELP